MGWAGQFNLDFMFMLLFSAVWVAWRHRFSTGGIALASLALFGGTPFLCVYLLIESTRSGGDVRAMLLGPRQHDH
jgi:thiol:disulfide interchange protein